MQNPKGKLILNRIGLDTSWSPPITQTAATLCCDELAKILIESDFYSNAKFKCIDFTIFEGKVNTEPKIGRTSKDLYLIVRIQIDTRELHEANEKKGLSGVCDIFFSTMIKMLEAIADKYKLGYDKKYSMTKPDWAKLDAEKKWPTREETTKQYNDFMVHLKEKERKEREEAKLRKLAKAKKT